MSGRRTLLVIASALIAALGTALVWLYVQGVESRAEAAAQASVDLQPVQVLTADADAGARTLATHEARVPRELAKDALPPGQAPTGHLRYSAVAGTILRPSMFTTGVPSGVTKGNQAASITIAAPQRVPALLKQGDHVAVYSYGPGDPRPQLELPDAVVRAVGADATAAGTAASSATGTGAAGAGGVPPEIVTFEGLPADMLKILAITTHGRTAALLINGEGVQPAGG